MGIRRKYSLTPKLILILIRKVVLILLLVSILLFVALDIYSGVLKANGERRYIYDNIAECENLAVIYGAERDFVRYSDTTEDDNIAGFEYESFFAGKYDSALMGFEIFAYQFKNVDDARNYFKIASRTDWARDEYPAAFSVRVRVWTSSVVAIYGTRCYTIHTTRLGEVILLSRFDEVFSLKIPV